MATIVLVHGILGIGAQLFPGSHISLPSVIEYFNGIAAHWTRPQINVMVPTVSPLKSIEDRGKELAKHLRNQLPQGRVDIVAHSMGGLDARWVLHHCPDIAARVTSLTTIGTPHLGSAVADKVHSSTQAVTQLIPQSLLEQIGALADLTVEKAKAFNRDTPDAVGVHYMNIAGVAPQGTQHPLLDLTAWIGELPGPNDGVVLRTSALYEKHRHLQDWPVDHFGQIGWGKWRTGLTIRPSDFYPDRHLERYDALLGQIRAIPERLIG